MDEILGSDGRLDVAIHFPRHPLLGSLRPWPIGFDTGMDLRCFDSPSGISGLAGFSDDRLDIVAVIANDPRTGQFRRFIAEAKGLFNSIYIWEVWEPVLDECLPRYGFVPIKGAPKDHNAAGFVWKKPV